jgi:hypothetical protein
MARVTQHESTKADRPSGVETRGRVRAELILGLILILDPGGAGSA